MNSGRERLDESFPTDKIGQRSQNNLKDNSKLDVDNNYRLLISNSMQGL